MNQLQQAVVDNETVEQLNDILNGKLAEAKTRAKSEGDTAFTNKNEKGSDVVLEMNDRPQPGGDNETDEENARKDERAKAQIRAKYEGDTAFIMAIKRGNKELVEAFLKHRLWETILEQENGAEKKGCCTGNGCCTVKGCCTVIHSPMNELIREMPDMAVLAMNRCITKGDNDNSFKFNCKYLEENCKRKCNHALYTADYYDRTDVIVHPLTIAFASGKWRKGIFLFYIVSLFVYLAFGILLTKLATLNYSAIAVIETQMRNETDNSNMRANTPGLEWPLFLLSGLLALIAVLLKLPSETRIHIVLINLIELAVFGCTFFMLLNNQTIDSYLNEFDIVPVTLFLAWFNLVLKMRKFPMFGIYFVMFTKIFKRLVLVIVLFSPLLIGFIFTFHLLLANKPLFTIERVFATIFSMLSGEVGYSENLTPHLTKTNPEAHEFLAFPALTIITLVTFILLVGISFKNLLVALAVSDVEKLYEDSQEELISVRIDEILDYDQIWAIWNQFVTKARCRIEKFAVQDIEIEPDKLYEAPENVIRWFKWLRRWWTWKVGYNKRLEAAYLNDIVEKNKKIEQGI